MFKKKKTDSSQPPDQNAATTQANRESARAVPPALSGVKHIIAVASGKGGVGKSTVSTNLAVALSRLGHRVGLMDADIYGPSQPNMLGAENAQAEITSDKQLVPVQRHGIDFVSISLLMDRDQPVIWRAPIATRMILQFISAVKWGERDFLLIDLPPGTGDVQLTLSQQAALTGAIIVTTPQKVALNVARKGLQMFEQVSVPILGIVENMSGFTCAHCGEETQVFHSGGGSLLAAEAGVPFLSAIPLDPAVMMSGDDGIPVAERDGNGSAGQAFNELARKLVSALADTEQSRGAGLPDSFGVNDTGELEIDWKDTGVARYAPRDLRISCVCALCVDEDSGKRTLDPSRVPLEISITSVKPVGRYGLSIAFSDGHDSGIYTFERLRKFSETRQQSFKL